MALESIGELPMHKILLKLDSTDAASVGCVSRQLHTWVSHDDLWAHFCSTDLSIQSPLDPLGNPAVSFKEAYRAWRDAFHMYPWSLVTRGKRCWDRLKTWLAANFPEVLPTLRRGASEDEIRDLERTLQVELPLPMKVLYRLCDGQEEVPNLLVNDGQEEVPNLFVGDGQEEVPNLLVGLIGGYSFYNHLVNVSLLPLHKIVEETRALQPGSSKIVVASSKYSEKNFTLDCTDRQLSVNLWDGSPIPCVPGSLLSPVQAGRAWTALRKWICNCS